MPTPEGQSSHGFTPPPPTTDVRNIQVSKANVLQRRSALLQEALDLREFLRSKQFELAIPVLGGDPVSRDASVAYTRKLVENPDSIWMRCMEYANNLLAAADALTATARSYGYTEEEITNSFRDTRG